MNKKNNVKNRIYSKKLGSFFAVSTFSPIFGGLIFGLIFGLSPAVFGQENAENVSASAEPPSAETTPAETLSAETNPTAPPAVPAMLPLSSEEMTALSQKLSGSTDETLLIEILQRPIVFDSDNPDAGANLAVNNEVYLKNLAAKRLAVIGTEKSVPALTELLKTEQLNSFARFALENMIDPAVNQALGESLKTLSGSQLVGVIDTLNVRKATEWTPILAEILKTTSDENVKKAAFAALGHFATKEALDILLDAVKNAPETGILTSELLRKGLSDALLEFGELNAVLTSENEKIAVNQSENTDNSPDKSVQEQKNALALLAYEAVLSGEFPQYAQFAAAYSLFMLKKPEELSSLIEKVKFTDKVLSKNTDDFDFVLKVLRDLDEDKIVLVQKPIFDMINVRQEIGLSDDRIVLILRAIGDRQNAPMSRNLLQLLGQQFIEENAKPDGKKMSGSIMIALLQSGIELCPTESVYEYCRNLTDISDSDFVQLTEVLLNIYSEVFSSPYSNLSKKYAKDNETLEKTISDLSRTILDQEKFSDREIQTVIMLFKVAENKRFATLAPNFVAVAAAKDIPPQIRDAALSVLAEVITLDNLNLLVDALNGETNDSKVDWILRSACTRLPREDCAKKVIEIYQKTEDTAQKLNLLTLLKQIGGKSALACVERACWETESPELMDKGTQILGEWNTPEDIEELAAATLKLANNAKDTKFKIRGIRSYIRLPRQFNISTEKRIEMCKIGFSVATRPDDKNLVFPVLTRISEQAGVDAALEYLQFPPYREKACETAVIIAEKIQGKTPQLSDAMKKVLENAQNQELKNRAQKILNRK